MPLSAAVTEARQRGFALLAGNGIEVGALHEPAAVPAAERITYVDAISRDQAKALFAEVDPALFVDPAVIIDLDRDGLRPFPDDSLDFIVMCHVLEHLANPIQTIAEVFRVLRPQGRAAIAIPDKRYTFDRPRAITPFDHVWTDYLHAVEESSDEHYLDFLAATTDFITKLSPAEQAEHIARAKARREHSHVWDSDAFRELLLLALPLTGRRAIPRFESLGEGNQFEYFGVWEKR